MLQFTTLWWFSSWLIVWESFIVISILFMVTGRWELDMVLRVLITTPLWFPLSMVVLWFSHQWQLFFWEIVSVWCLMMRHSHSERVMLAPLNESYHFSSFTWISSLSLKEMKRWIITSWRVLWLKHTHTQMTEYIYEYEYI